MDTTLNAKSLRSRMAEVLRRASKGERFVVLYRGHPTCRIVPVGPDSSAPGDLKKDPLYEAKAVGRSRDRKRAADHDEILYGKGS